MIKKLIVPWHETPKGKLYRKSKRYKEYQKAYQKAYQREYQKNYHKTKKYKTYMKSYMKKYNKANRSKISAYNRAYYLKNKKYIYGRRTKKH